MKKIIFYLFILLIGLTSLMVLNELHRLPKWVSKINLLFICIAIGGIGGITYCFRSIYINACVRKNWDPDWQPWYYIRPFISMISGGISWLFLKAGLLILDATQSTGSTSFGFFALAFIAGYNVDNFLKKIEEVSESTWGINKSSNSNS